MLPTPFYALISYEDPYVQPLILAALSSRLPPSSYKLITSLSELPSPSAPLLQFQAYETLAFDRALAFPSTTLVNAYVIRKALIRKHYLSTTIRNWIVKHPDSVLARHVKPAVELEVDYAEFLDEALVEAWELRESWKRGEGNGAAGREWWILKPGMSERGQGIRLFSCEEELVGIFEEWEAERGDSEDEDEDEDEDEEDREEEAATRSDDEDATASAVAAAAPATAPATEQQEGKEKDYIITSQLRHFIAQPYIDPPLLFDNRKFHIRTYVLAAGALRVYVYKPMLALFAASPYHPPTSSQRPDLRAHLTNTCLQGTTSREGSVRAFWDLPRAPGLPADWQTAVFEQIRSVTGETFLAAARGMMVHFQPVPSAFEIFGLDFMVDAGGRAWLLEVNAFPDFGQTGVELRGLVGGLMEGVVDVAVKPFFGVGGAEGCESMVKVLDVDLGKR